MCFRYFANQAVSPQHSDLAGRSRALAFQFDGSDFGSSVTSADGKFTFSDFLNLFLFSEKYDIGAVVKALQTKGLFQSLAEPNLVAESGKEASFLAGGEFPYPVPQVANGSTPTRPAAATMSIRPSQPRPALNTHAGGHSRWRVR